MSLASGIAGGVLMERNPTTAALVLVAGILGWGAAVLVVLAGRLDPEAYTGRKRLLVKGAKLSGVIALQSLLQQNLLFAFPLYLAAAALLPSHLAFLALLTVAVAVSLWDPVFNRVAAHAAGRLVLGAFATFVGTNALLPMLGVGNGTSLVLAVVVAALGLFLDPEAPFARVTDVRRRVAVRAGIALSGAVLVWLGAGLIPPAPLKLVDGGMGTVYEEHALKDRAPTFEGAPPQLVCATAIAAPRGVKDALFHVWRKDGVLTDRIPLVISGGRDAGFRTYSQKTRLGNAPFGTWRCTVETGAGQVLGTRQIVVRRALGNQ